MTRRHSPGSRIRAAITLGKLVECKVEWLGEPRHAWMVLAAHLVALVAGAAVAFALIGCG